MSSTSSKLLLFFVVVVLMLGVGTYHYRQHLRVQIADLILSMREGVSRERGIMVEMRDGVKLKTNVLRPVDASGPLPTVYIQNTYHGFDFSWAKFFVLNGYAVVEQQVRGRFGSEGQYSLYESIGRDGSDTIDWIVAQPWSNDKVGSFGCSYQAESQTILAAENHPNHVAMILDGGGGAIGKVDDQYGYFGVYENGVLNLASSVGWFSENGHKANSADVAADTRIDPALLRATMATLPVVDLVKRLTTRDTFFEDYVSHALADKWWDQQGYINKDDRFSAAALHVNSWYDQTVDGSLALANHMRKAANNERARHQYLLIAPGVHCSAAKHAGGRRVIGEMEIDFEFLDYRKIYLDWFDYWLKDKAVELPPKVKYYDIHGKGWVDADQWPPQDVQLEKFFLSDANLVSRPEENGLSVQNSANANFREFVYDPLRPVPTRGGSICCTGNPDDIQGPVDQSSLVERADVLSYTSKPLQQPFCLAGVPKARLAVSTDAVDTDFTVKLVDVYPDGRMFNIQDGVARLSLREGITRFRPAQPGEIYDIDVVLRASAYTFRKGHKIGLLVSSSNFPRLVRNLNTGDNSPTATKTVKATNRVYSGEKHLSSIILPNACP